MWLTLALFSSILCQPALAQSPQEQASSSDPGNSTSVPQSGDSTNSGADASPTSDGSSDSANRCDVSQIRACLKDFFSDQAGIWTSPLRLHPQDVFWLLPLAGATAASLNYDVQTLQQVSTSPNRIRISADLSNAGAYGAIGIAGGTYIIGKLIRNETARETGVLSLEAIADSSLVTEVLKLVTNRERPYVGTGQGRFWPDGTDTYTTNGSFPSEHATVGFFACSCGRNTRSSVAPPGPLCGCGWRECRPRDEQESFSVGCGRRFSDWVSSRGIRLPATLELL